KIEPVFSIVRRRTVLAFEFDLGAVDGYITHATSDRLRLTDNAATADVSDLCRRAASIVVVEQLNLKKLVFSKSNRGESHRIPTENDSCESNARIRCLLIEGRVLRVCVGDNCVREVGLRIVQAKVNRSSLARQTE